MNQSTATTSTCHNITSNTTIDFDTTNSNPNIGGYLRLLQLNIEGISARKCSCLERILLDENIDIAVIQETHLSCEGVRSQIQGFTMVSALHHEKFGIATYVKDDLLPSVQLLPAINSFCIGIKVNDLNIINVYKPPSEEFESNVLPSFEKPTIVIGDFNSHNTLWGYSDDDTDGENVVNWMTREDFSLLYDATDPKTFRSARWRRSYTPDLCFVSKDIHGNVIPATRRVLSGFPNSQHRPVVVNIGLQLPIIRADKKNRWNFTKANWEMFASEIERTINRIPPFSSNYSRFVGLIKKAAKVSIPRGNRTTYIPGWSEENQALYEDFRATGDSQTGKQLLSGLDIKRREEWENKMKNLSFTKSSKKTWGLLHRLNGKNKNTNRITSVSPNSIAAQLVANSQGSVPTHQKKTVNNAYLNNLRNSPRNTSFSAPFTELEIHEAMTMISSGKASGIDNIYPDLLKHLGPKAKNWLAKLFTQIHRNGKVPTQWKKARIIAALKPNKPANETQSYRPISLLSCCFKLFERCLIARIGELIDSEIPQEQGSCRKNRNCCDQVLSLTTYIELGFEKCLKTGVVFIDLSAAFDTVWKRGLMFKLSRIIKCQTTLNIIMNILSDRNIQVEINGKISRTRILNNGIPQGSVLSSFLYNIYTSDIPPTKSRKFMYADDIAMAYESNSFEVIEKVLNEDLEILAEYFKNWRLRPNVGKTVSCVFHLNNRKANRQLQLRFDNGDVRHEKFPKYLGIYLDRSLTFKRNMESVRSRLKSRINVVQKLTGTSWGCSAKTLCVTTKALILSVAEYCSPVWMRSAHVKLIDTQINVALRIISGTVHSTPIPWIHVLSNIAPASIVREQSAIRECTKILNNPELPIHNDMISAPTNQRLKSRKPFWIFYRNDMNMDEFKVRWKNWWNESTVTNQVLIPDPTVEIKGFNLPRKIWLRLNRIRTGHGCCAYLLNKWGLSDSPLCECGEVQTMLHLVQNCRIHRFEGNIEEINNVSDNAINWLANLAINI